MKTFFLLTLLTCSTSIFAGASFEDNICVSNDGVILGVHELSSRPDGHVLTIDFLKKDENLGYWISYQEVAKIILSGGNEGLGFVSPLSFTSNDGEAGLLEMNKLETLIDGYESYSITRLRITLNGIVNNFACIN